jgi:hypothetical protein
MSRQTIWGESIHGYFVEIKFCNSTTSEMPAGMTSFPSFFLPTENDVPRVNVSLTRTGVGCNLKVDMLQSNYTIKIFTFIKVCLGRIVVLAWLPDRLFFRFVRASYHGHWPLFTGRDRRIGQTLLSRYAHLSSRLSLSGILWS